MASTGEKRIVVGVVFSAKKKAEFDLVALTNVAGCVSMHFMSLYTVHVMFSSWN